MGPLASTPAPSLGWCRKCITSRRPRPRQVVGRDAKLGAFLVRVLPFRAIYALTAGRD